MGCMKHMMKHMHRACVALAAVLTAVGCAKYMGDVQLPPFDTGKFTLEDSEQSLAIGTLGSKDGDRYVKLSENTCSKVMNPDVVEDIPDHTRIFLEFRYVVASLWSSSYTDAILVEWASPLDVGVIRYDMMAEACDPVDIVTDWMTSLEDGFLTLHYSIPTSGSVKHDFSLYPGADSNSYRLVHDAHGDLKGAQTDGIVCFDVSAILPKTEGKTVELSFVYIDLNQTEKRLTVDYCSPK